MVRRDKFSGTVRSSWGRRWVAVVILVGALGGLSAGYWLATTLESPLQRAPKAEPPPRQPVTTTITGDARSFTLTAPVSLTSAGGSAVLPPTGTPSGVVVT